MSGEGESKGIVFFGEFAKLYSDWVDNNFELPDDEKLGKLWDILEIVSQRRLLVQTEAVFSLMLISQFRQRFEDPLELMNSEFTELRIDYFFQNPDQMSAILAPLISDVADTGKNHTQTYVQPNLSPDYSTSEPQRHTFEQTIELLLAQDEFAPLRGFQDQIIDFLRDENVGLFFDQNLGQWILPRKAMYSLFESKNPDSWFSNTGSKLNIMEYSARELGLKGENKLVKYLPLESALQYMNYARSTNPKNSVTLVFPDMNTSDTTTTEIGSLPVIYQDTTQSAQDYQRIKELVVTAGLSKDADWLTDQIHQIGQVDPDTNESRVDIYDLGQLIISKSSTHQLFIPKVMEHLEIPEGKSVTIPDALRILKRLTYYSGAKLNKPTNKT